MYNLENAIKELAVTLGLDLVGIASADELNQQAPEGRRPQDYLKEAKSVIVLGMRLFDPIIDGIPETRGIYSRMMWASNWELDNVSYKIARFLTLQDYLTLPMPVEIPYSMGKLIGMFSHKHAAVMAGLGEFGLNNLVLTPEYGPRQRFTSILTEAMLTPSDRTTLNLCENALGQCNRSCVAICPVDALISALEMPPNSVRLHGLPINSMRCQYYNDRGLPKVNDMKYRCGLCVKACPVGSRRLRPAPLDKVQRPI